MRRIIILILQIICLLLVVTNHCISVIVNSGEIYIITFGILIQGFIVDFILYFTIALQIIIIILMELEYERSK